MEIMQSGTILEKDVEGPKHSYDIVLVDTWPIRVSVVHDGRSVWTVTVPEDVMIREMFAKPIDPVNAPNANGSDATDAALNNLVQVAVDCLKSDIKQGFVDRFIDRQP